jgi:hypothetical protein
VSYSFYTCKIDNKNILRYSGALIVLLLYLLREKEERVKKILNRKKYVFMETSYVDCYAFSL